MLAVLLAQKRNQKAKRSGGTGAGLFEPNFLGKHCFSGLLTQINVLAQISPYLVSKSYEACTARFPMEAHRNEPVPGASRVASTLLAQKGLVSATLILFMFLAVSPSQACEFESNFPPPTARIAPQIVAQPLATVSGAVVFAVVNTACGCLGAGHCHGLCWACSCCPACSAGMIAESWVPTSHSPQRIAISFFHTPLPSTESDALFRPPRLFV